MIVPVLNRLIPLFGRVFFSRDWHPPDHVSFTERPEFKDMSWPPHCVRDTPGAAFPDSLDVPERAAILSKGTDPGKEAYSAFSGTGLAGMLSGCRRLFVGGLAAEFCVKSSVLDALEEGFEVLVIRDAVGGLDIPPGSCEEAFSVMRRAGARTILSTEIA